MGYVLAEKLEIPFDVAVVRKIQIPWNTESGFGAVTWDGRPIMNEPLVAQLGLGAAVVEQCISRTRQTVHERNWRPRGVFSSCMVRYVKYAAGRHFSS